MREKPASSTKQVLLLVTRHEGSPPQAEERHRSPEVEPSRDCLTPKRTALNLRLTEAAN